MEEWWEEPIRVLQYNLQVKDTAGMVPEKLAKETEDLHANVVVLNVGGIYAWYQSEVPYHHVNEFLPAGRDLLKELIDAFHARSIRFVARFDFSITDDTTYLAPPEWFARKADNEPFYKGEKRMGNWSLFLNTCSSGGYRNEAVAVPVLKEVLGRYDIDGIFLNAPTAQECHCLRCKAAYLKKYGTPMPDEAEEIREDWYSYRTKENVGNLYRAVKETREEVPLILYYAPFTGSKKSSGRDSIYDRLATADLICTESQDVLSRGVNALPETIHPVLAMKSGQIREREKLPFGIIHSCPGMDWRHVGMPVTEYLPWMSQVPASGGILWHSVTGYPDTITDKRVLKAVGTVDAWAEKCGPDMQGVRYLSDVCLLWNGDLQSRGWADALVKDHVQFDLMQNYDFSPEDLFRYGAVIKPASFKLADPVREALSDYVRRGGKLLSEITDAEELSANTDFFGVQPEITESEYLAASYLRFEPAGEDLKKNMDTDKIPFRGKVLYVRPEGGETLATLVPPFAPLEVVGAPPERASMPVPKTDLPLAVSCRQEKGEVILLPFNMSTLVTQFHLRDHYDFIGNLLDRLLGDRRTLAADAPHDLQITAYEKENTVLIHLVNETGTRPLLDTIPLNGMEIRVKLGEGLQVKEVTSVIEGNQLAYSIEDGWLRLTDVKVTVWDMLKIQFESTKKRGRT